MRGNLRQVRPGVWEARTDAGRDPVTGRRRQPSKTIHGTRREAERVLNAMTAKFQDDHFEATRATFTELSERWMSNEEARLSPSTTRSHRELLRNHVLPAIGNLPLAKIGTFELDQLYAGLESRGQLKANSIRRVHAVVSGAFNQALRWGWITSNPASNARPPRQTKCKINPPNVGQVAALMHHAFALDERFGRFLHIAATTGARRGELCALRWRNVDFAGGTLTIERGIIDTLGGSLEKDTKTHSIRRIALDRATLATLESQFQVASKFAKFLGETVSEDAFIFTREIDGSRPWRPDFATKRFTQTKRAAGISEVRLHDLRHFTATTLLAAGTDVRTVSGRLGHANAATTLSVYAHFVGANDRKASDLLGALVADARSWLN